MQPSERLFTLFAGRADAYGQYREAAEAGGTGKRGGRAQTVRGTLAPSLWENHLAGRVGLGVVPICSDNTCSWGAVDLDIYPLDLESLAKRLAAEKLPLVVCRSKSGGAHVYLLLQVPEPASVVVQCLRTLAARLGWTGSEIFPKQVSTAEGDVGNWLNMPYFGGADSLRYGLDDQGKALGLEEFVEFAAARQTTTATLSALIAEPEVLDEAPPCLNVLCGPGRVVQTGQRNEFLFGLATYLRRADPDGWRESLRHWAQQTVPEFPSKEIETIAGSVDRKQYSYRCREQPLAAHCDREVCLTRRYGVGPEGAAVAEITGLSRLDCDPPLWFLTVYGQRVQFTSQQLTQQPKFQLRCLEAVNRVPQTLKQGDWIALLNRLLENLEVVEVPPEAGRHGAFVDLLESFCATRFQARTYDELALGKPMTEGEYHLFRLGDLQRFLQEERYTEYNRAELVSALRDLGGEPRTLRVAGSQRRIWAVPRFDAPTESTPF